MTRQDNRTSDRIPATLRIRLKYTDEASFVEKYSINISRGGIFIATRVPKPVGTMLRFEFQLAHGEALIRGEGSVVWVRPFDPVQPERSHGMGVRFTRLDAESRKVIDRALAWKEEHGARPRSNEPARSGNEATRLVRGGERPRAADEDTRRVSLAAAIARSQDDGEVDEGRDDVSPAEELFGRPRGEIERPMTIELEAEEASDEERLERAPQPNESGESQARLEEIHERPTVSAAARVPPVDEMTAPTPRVEFESDITSIGTRAVDRAAPPPLPRASPPPPPRAAFTPPAVEGAPAGEPEDLSSELEPESLATVGAEDLSSPDLLARLGPLASAPLVVEEPSSLFEPGDLSSQLEPEAQAASADEERATLEPDPATAAGQAPRANDVVVEAPAPNGPRPVRRAGGRLAGFDEAFAFLTAMKPRPAPDVEDPVERFAVDWAVSPVRLEAALGVGRSHGGSPSSEAELDRLLDWPRPERLPDPAQARDLVAGMLAARERGDDPSLPVTRATEVDVAGQPDSQSRDPR